MDVFKLETLHQVLISSADSELFSFLNSLLVKKTLKNLKKFLISFCLSRNLSTYIVKSVDKITLQLPLSFQLLWVPSGVTTPVSLLPVYLENINAFFNFKTEN